MIVVLLWAAVTFTPVLRYWIAPLSTPWDDASGDVLVVLGAGANADNSVDYHSYLRALHAANVYRARGFREVFITGAGGAPAIQRYLVGLGLPADRIHIESEARSTRENAEFTRRALGATTGRLVLLTSDYHTYRATRVFRKAGLDLRTSPAPDAGKRMNSVLERWSVFLDLGIETAKVAWYRLRGWM